MLHTSSVFVLTAKRCPIHTDRPMARAGEPLRSLRFGSQLANTVKTNWNVMKASTTRAWPADMLVFTCHGNDTDIVVVVVVFVVAEVSISFGLNATQLHTHMRYLVCLWCLSTVAQHHPVSPWSLPCLPSQTRA